MKTKFPDLNLDFSFHPVQTPQPHRFTPQQVEQYNRDGYISNITIFEGAQFAAVQKFFRDINRDDITSKGEVFQSFHHTAPELYDVVTNSLLVEYLQDVLGPNVVCFISQYVCKDPGSQEKVVWHQDASFNPMDARSVIVWLAIEDAFIENGCMWFIPGSHRNGLLEFDQPKGHEIADAEAYGTPVPIELRAGQVVMFSDLLLHSSPPNQSKTSPRPGLTISYTSAEVVPYHNAERASVLCSGQDIQGRWKHHARPWATLSTSE
jgi:ectoine hydroxylase-related dioxygenase (phytanoyl-CoA dioxygenase family)